MGSATQAQLERAELEAIIHSGIFQRAPNLACILRYVCDRYFEGEGEQIKEYNIAVEALGRAPSFDQKKDSIVRVEIHRLRKRLAAYYKGPGCAHAVHIVIPSGQYAPQFLIPANDEEIAPVSAPDLTVKFDQIAVSNPALATDPAAVLKAVGMLARLRSRPVLVTAVMLSLGVVAAVVLTIHSRTSAKPHKVGVATAAPEEIWKGVATGPVNSEFRLLAGYHGPPFTDRQGRLWNPDSHYSGGRSSAIPAAQAIESLPDPNLPRTFRSGRFTYNLPLRNGTYELHLYFVEPRYGMGTAAQITDTSRLFRVVVNGEVKLDPFDIVSEAGAPNRVFERVFKDVTPDAGGMLRLEFIPLTDDAILNAIEILPSLPNRIRPVRIIAQPSSITDANGETWMADHNFVGGLTVVRRDSVTNVKQWSLYEGERYGNFSYRIPLAPGKYRLTLHFAETWFGRPEALSLLGLAPTAPPVGLRVFNVFANGIALLRQFDIAKAAGGAHRGIAKVFSPIMPNAQGLLILEFVPEKNYACVNAIKVEEID